MNNILKNNKGIVLITVYFVLVVLLGLSAVTFMRSTNEARIARRSTDSLQAFYEAEAGISYAYYELSQHGFDWTTHQDKDTPEGTFPNTAITLGGNPGNVYAQNNCYRIRGRDFWVKSYPDPNAPDDVVVVLSTAEVNGISRTIEYRLGQESAYQYFFFYPKEHTFGSITYDGRNFGAIHVNANITLKDYPKFYYLTSLTCAAEDDTGYFKQYKNASFRDYQGNVDYPTSIVDPTQLNYYMYITSTYHYNTGYTTFITGDYGSGTTDYLYYYLDDAHASWDYDKYSGTPGGNPERHYKLDYEEGDIPYRPLYDLAVYEMTGGRRSSTDYKNLLSDTTTLTVNGIPELGKLDDTELNIFKQIYNHTFTNTNQRKQAYDKLFEEWKKVHKNDFTSYGDDKDWERRFFQAAYDWGGGAGEPNNINREWWEDMEYGSDRTDGITGDYGEDTALAQVEDSKGVPIANKFFLNTEEQASAWATWLNGHNLDTVVQDSNGTAVWIDPGTVIDEGDFGTDNELEQKAKNGGIYIGTGAMLPELAAVDFTGDGRLDWDDDWNIFWQAIMGQVTWPEYYELSSRIWDNYGYEGEPENPISDCVVETQFYNSTHPAGYYVNASWDKYKPSNILVIDVKELKEKIAKPVSEGGMGGDFNGVVYVDLDAYDWSFLNCDYNAMGVMLVNGEVLPEEGLSIVTPHNVYIKGNYNLDPEGCPEKNRPADDDRYDDTDGNFIENYVIGETRYSRIDDGAYTLSWNDLAWQPAEIITRRAVYTLSENFLETSYTPMAFSHSQQYYEERDHVEGQDYVSGDPDYPTDSWVPSVAITRANSSYKTKMNQWFQYYYTGTVPTKWTKGWINTNWPSNEVFSLDTDAPGAPGYGEPDTFILSNDLRNDVWNHIESIYDSTYGFTTIHGTDPQSPTNPGTASQDQSVSQKHIYNTAIVTPYSTSPYVLEYWGDTDRVINGAFIQLPGGPTPGSNPSDWTYASKVPKGIRYSRTDAPDNFCNYESRFGQGAIAADRPAVGLTFGADSSWREINSANF